jgi:hypothetical protein
MENVQQCQQGAKRLLRDISSLKELYSNKLVQQEHLSKQLRMQQKVCSMKMLLA